MRTLILLAVITCCLTGNLTASETDHGYQLYLVRHAEKQSDGTRDPHLTEAGMQRSARLAEWLQDKGIQQVWSSDYHRSRETAEPLLAGTGLDLSIYDPNKLAALADSLLETHLPAVVVGHSNTTPELARLLCRCEVEDMGEADYDRLIVVSVISGSTAVRTLDQSKLFQP